MFAPKFLGDRLLAGSQKLIARVEAPVTDHLKRFCADL